MTELDDQVITEFRANAGAVLDAMGGHFKNVHLLLLHHTGRRSGKLYVTPLLFIEDGDKCVLIGSNGGAEKAPAWVDNVAAMPEVVIEVGERTLYGQADNSAGGPGMGPSARGGGGLLARHPRIPDPHHPKVPVRRPGPGLSCDPPSLVSGSGGAAAGVQG